MIDYVKNKDIDRQKWDAVILGAANGNIFNLSWYLDTLSEDWDAFVEGDYEVVMPLPFTRKAGVKVIYQPFFSRQIGIFSMDSRPIDAATYLKCLTDRFKTGSFGFDLIDIPVGAFEVKKRPHQVIDLTIGMEYIRSRYSNNARRILKKIPETAAIEEVNDPAFIVEMFRTESEKKIRELGSSDFEKLKDLMTVCQNHNAGKAYQMVNNGELIAGAFYMTFGNTITFLKSFVTNKGKDIGAMYAMMDFVMEAHVSEYNTFDFGGSSVSSVAQFNKKFGSTDSFYVFLSFDQAPVYFKLLRRLRNKLKK